jgi:tetratricopeptide (TPR) repeat protein
MVDGAAKSQSPMPAEVGVAAQDPAKNLGKYVKVARVGAGGMGEVWKAWDRELHRWVALKFLKHDAPEELERFRREAQTAAQLNHPNIAAVYEVGESSGKPFIAMQFVAGVTLGSFPRKDLHHLVRLVRDAAVAVHYAHERKVIHRDLKPANLMVDPLAVKASGGSGRPSTARVYVLDFGLARQTTIDSSLSVSGTALGTPAYMAPEQARGEIHAVNELSDVYSLGATLYDVLAGGPPFREKDLYALLRKVVETDPLPLRKRNPAVNEELETIVMKCLEKEPGRRYHSALAFAEDLGRWLEGEAILAQEPTAAYRIRKGLARHKAAAIAAAVVVLLLAAVGISWVHAGMTRDREREEHLERAGVYFQKEQYQLALEHFSRALELGGGAEVRARLVECQTLLERVSRRARAQSAARPAFVQGKAGLDEAVNDLYRQGADLVMTRSRLEGAISELTRALELWAEFPDALQARGRAHALRFEYDLADKDYSRAIELEPGSLIARRARGKLLLERTIEAKFNMGWVWDVSVAQPFDQWKARARTDLVDEAYISFAEDRLADCIQACANRLRENPKQEELQKLQGDAFYLSASATFSNGVKVPEEKVLGLALASYTEALRLRPNYYEARLMRGSTYLKANRLKEAREDLEAALKNRPDDALACSFMAEMEESPAVALPWLDRGVRANPESFMIRMRRARVLALLNRNPEAREELDLATRLNPGHYYGWYLRGALRGRTGDMEGAYQDFKETTRRAPLNESAWFNLGATAKNTGRFREAVDAWEQALKLGASNRAEIEQLLSETRKKLGS